MSCYRDEQLLVTAGLDPAVHGAAPQMPVGPMDCRIKCGNDDRKCFEATLPNQSSSSGLTGRNQYSP